MSAAIKYSGIVVACNDALRLKSCLESLSFCEQLVVIDLMSEDDTVTIAKSCGAEVHKHERVPVVELIRETAFSYARHPWIVHIDPDEIFPKERLQEVTQLVASPDLAIIRLPWQFFFKRKPLSGTIWGGENSKPCVFHRERIVLSKNVHVCPQPLESFREIRILDFRKGALSHFWVDSYGQMIEKHMRYIRREGMVKYEAGERFSWNRWFTNSKQAFKESLITHGGWHDGMTGVLLSVFYAWYVAMCYLSLRNYQRQVAQDNSKL